MSSADQTKKAMVELFYPKRPDGSICFDRREWLREGYKSLLEEHDIYIVLQVHDELLFDVPANIDPEVLKKITDVMCNCIPNDAGVRFKSDVEIAPYWNGNFSFEQIRLMNEGKLDWRKVFEEEVKKKLEKFGIEYRPGVFAELNDEEAYVANVFEKEGLDYRMAGSLSDEDDENEDSTEEVISA